MKSATKMGEEEGSYEKLLCDDKKAAESDAGDYVDKGEKKKRKFGQFKVLFYAFGMVALLPMGVLSLCLSSMIDATPGPEPKSEGFFSLSMIMIMCFYMTSQLGGSLLCETVSSLNSSKAPELIDFAGVGVCGLTTIWGFYYASEICLLIISGNTAAGYLLYCAYVFTLVSAVLTFGFLVRVCHFLICCYHIGFQGVVGGRVQTNSYPRRGSTAKDIYTLLVISIYCAIMGSIAKDFFKFLDISIYYALSSMVLVRV